MKIEGHRPYFDTGPGVAPAGLQPTQAQSVKRAEQSAPDAVTRVTKTVGSVATHRHQTGPAGTSDEPKDRSLAERGAETSGEAEHDPGSGIREPTLPQLSAEALATALMTAEPDKAIVPRVLPTDMAASDDP